MENIITDILSGTNKSVEQLIQSFKTQEIDQEQFLSTLELLIIPVVKIILGGNEEMRDLRAKIIIPEQLNTIVRKADHLEDVTRIEHFIAYIKSL